MAGRSRIRTDLALEATERFQAENVEVRGVEIRERYDEEKDVRTTVVRITTENGARTMGKPQGTYITIEAPDLSFRMRIITGRSRKSGTSFEGADRSRTAAVDPGGRPWKSGDYCGFPWPSCSFQSSYDKACDPGIWAEEQ